MARTINTILVDDEPGCLSNLQHYIAKYCPDLRVIGQATDLDSTATLINTMPVQLAFLDVHLFDRTIFEVLPANSSQDFAIVFVTAYEQYALSAFRVSALDYILKPLERDEIIRCYSKIVRHFEAVTPVPGANPDKPSKIMLRQGDHVYITSVEHILYLRAQGFYTIVGFEQDGKLREIMISKPINIVHQEWQAPQLMRVHRSYVINLQQVASIRKIGAAISLQLGEQVVPVAKRRAAEFLERYHG